MKIVELFEGTRAQTYDQNIRIWCPEYDAIQGILPLVIGHHLNIKSENSMLVVGSGTGTEMMNLLQCNPNWHVTGVDPSPEMVAQADLRLQSFQRTAGSSLPAWWLTCQVKDDLMQHWQHLFFISYRTTALNCT